MTRRQAIQLVLTLLAAALCLWVVLRDVDLENLGESLAGANPARVVATIGILGAVFGLRIVRFQLLLGGEAPALSRQVVASGVGYLALNVLPLRLGEFVRPAMLRRDGVPWGASLSAIVMERVADLLALLGMLASVSWLVVLPETLLVQEVDVLSAGQRAVGVGMSALLLGLLLSTVLPMAAWLEHIPVLGPRLASVASRLAETVRALARRPLTMASVAVLSVLIWSGTVGSVAVLLGAFEGLPTSIEVALTVTSTTVVATLVVPTPGSVGPFELFATATLGLWSPDAATALAFAGLWHLLVFGFHTSLGLVLLLGEGVSLRDLALQKPTQE